MKIERLQLELEDSLARQVPEVLGCRIYPPYAPARVKQAISVLVNHLKNDRVHLRNTVEYAQYLQRRFPVLGEIARDVEECLPDSAKTVVCLEASADAHAELVKKRRAAVRKLRRSPPVRTCQLCGFDFSPVLQLHHLIPLAEGGGNETLVILCPNCHAGVHELTKTTRRALARRHKQAFQWWQEKRDMTGWWARAGERIIYLANLYREYHDSKNYEDFTVKLANEEPEVALYRVDPVAESRLLPFVT